MNIKYPCLVAIIQQVDGSSGKVSAAEARLLPIRRWSLSCLCRKATGWSSCRRMP